MRRRTSLLAPVVALVCLPFASSAQNIAGSPVHGTVTLDAGFLPDPHIVDVNAGGKGYSEAGGCSAYINPSAPALNLNYRAGDYALTIEARSYSDVTLLVNAPDGSWYCDDDGGDGTNSALTFDPPLSGLYNIWVGTFYDEAASGPSAQVYVTELGVGFDSGEEYGTTGACLPGASYASTIPAGRRVTIVDISPEDAYFSDRGSMIGLSGTVQSELGNWGDCWFHGPVTGDDGTEWIFYEVQLSESFGGAAAEPACLANAARASSIRPGQRVTVIEIAPADAFSSSRNRIIGLTGTVGEGFDLQDGCWYAGPMTTSNGTEYYFLRVQIAGQNR